MVNQKLIKDLKSKTFSGFAELARYLREEVAQMNRHQLGIAMGYEPRSGCAVVQQIEDGIKIAGAVSLVNYLRHFPELDPGYASRLVANDRARNLHESLLARLSR